MAEVELDLNDEVVEEFEEALDRAQGTVEYPADYAVYVEYPTDPHWPPHDAIRDWIEVKWTRLSDGFLEAAHPSGAEWGGDKHIERATYMVQKAIAANGTDGVYFASRSLNHFEQGEAMELFEEECDPDGPPGQVAEAMQKLVGAMHKYSDGIV